MGGVDIADQFRASYHTHRPGVRNWLPLFYWLLDTLKVNSYLLWRSYYPQALHKKFQLALSRQLIAEGLYEHQNQRVQEKVVSTSYQIRGLPPPEITPLDGDGDGAHRVNNAVHCISYIHKIKILVRTCITCKKATRFNCINCQNAFCFGPGSTCIDRYPCSYIVK